MWSWIKMESVVIVQDNWLHKKGKWAEMTLMSYGSNKLQQKPTRSLPHKDLNDPNSQSKFSIKQLCTYHYNNTS